MTHPNQNWKTVAVCMEPNCNNIAAINYYRDDGTACYKHLCNTHHKRKYGMKQGAYQKYKKHYCENTDGRLGWTCSTRIMTSAELEVDHIDCDDSGNHNPNKLQTLCSACHRRKTIIERLGALPPLPNESIFQANQRQQISEDCRKYLNRFRITKLSAPIRTCLDTELFDF